MEDSDRCPRPSVKEDRSRRRSRSRKTTASFSDLPIRAAFDLPQNVEASVEDATVALDSAKKSLGQARATKAAAELALQKATIDERDALGAMENARNTCEKL